MVPQNGSIQKDKDKISFLGRWVARFWDLVRLFKNFGSEDSENKLIFELVSLTEKDELVWQFRNEDVDVFEAYRNDIPLRLEMGYGGPTLFTAHVNIKSRITKNRALDFLVETIFKQEARYHRQREINDFDPDAEFKKILLPLYQEFLKKRS